MQKRLDVLARSLSEPLGCLCMGKQMRWLVGHIETDKSTEAVFDLLWPLLDKGERRLSVRRAVNRHALHFLIYKADQAKLEFATLPEEVRPAAVYELLKPGRGQAGTRAILQFARAWFADSQQITANFNVAEDAPAPPPVGSYGMNCAIDASKTCTSTSGARGCSRPRREHKIPGRKRSWLARARSPR